jgi:hypothetical protein
MAVDVQSTVYNAGVLTLSDEQREAIAQYGTPLPVIEADDGKAYIILGVNFERADASVFRAVAPGVNAVGEGDLPSDALFALCAAIQTLADSGP